MMTNWNIFWRCCAYITVPTAQPPKTKCLKATRRYDMKTAREMYQYCLQNKYYQNWEKNIALKNLSVIEENLQPNEDVLMCFLGTREPLFGKCAFAITNKHIIWGQKKLFSTSHGEKQFSSITNITSESHAIHTWISFCTFSDTVGAALICSVKNDTAKSIYEKCKSIFEQAKNNISQSINTISNISNADEILKYKNLLDIGAITKEEFEAKKKQLIKL